MECKICQSAITATDADGGLFFSHSEDINEFGHQIHLWARDWRCANGHQVIQWYEGDPYTQDCWPGATGEWSFYDTPEHYWGEFNESTGVLTITQDEER